MTHRIKENRINYHRVSKVGLFDPHIVRKEFKIPGYIKPTALVILGYCTNLS